MIDYIKVKLFSVFMINRGAWLIVLNRKVRVKYLPIEPHSNGRFGGGWKFTLAIRATGSDVVLEMIIVSIRISRRREPEDEFIWARAYGKNLWNYK